MQDFARLDVDGQGKVDYLSFTKGISIHRGAEIASNCRNQGPVCAGGAQRGGAEAAE